MDKIILKDTAFDNKDDYSHYMNQMNNQVLINDFDNKEYHGENNIYSKRSLYEKYLDTKYLKNEKTKEIKQIQRHNSNNSIDRQKSKSPNDIIKNTPSKKLIKQEKEREISVIDKNINSLNNSFISSLKLIEPKEKKEILADQKVSNNNRLHESVVKANNKLYYEEVNKFMKDRQNSKNDNKDYSKNNYNEHLDLIDNTNIAGNSLFKKTFDKFSSRITSEDPIYKQNLIKKYNDLNANSNYYFPSKIYNTNINTNLYNDLQYKETTNKNKLYNISCATKR